MNPNKPTRRPCINSRSVRQLSAHIRTLRRRNIELDEIVNRIQNKDNATLHELVIRTQRGDPEAAAIAIWALLPHMCAVVARRRPLEAWAPTIDHYISIAYLVIIDIRPDEPIDHLGDKIVSRTRLRHERAAANRRSIPVVHDILDSLGPRTDELELRVVARLEIESLAASLRNGLVKPEAWQAFAARKFDDATTTTATDAQRSRLARTQRRLREWRAEAA